MKFGAAAPQQTSIWISLIAGYVLPIAIFILLGRWLSKKMMSSMGGGPGGAMSFGKSNAKVYVESTTGITFNDVAGEDEAKELLTEEEPNFNPLFDPKCNWALKNLEYFPVEINRAPYQELLRVPGVGVKSAQRIVAARRSAGLPLPAGCCPR